MHVDHHRSGTYGLPFASSVVRAPIWVKVETMQSTCDAICIVWTFIVLCNHNLVEHNLVDHHSDPLDTSLDGFLSISTTSHIQVCYIMP